MSPDEIKLETASPFVRGRIRTKKLTGHLYLAECKIKEPINATVEITGKTKQNASTKLRNFFEGKPYVHIP